MDIKTDIDLDEAKTFFGPHDGRSGAASPVPTPIKDLIDAFDGKTETLRSVTDRLVQLVGETPGELTVRWSSGLGHGSIMLRLGGPQPPIHIWRLISFR